MQADGPAGALVQDLDLKTEHIPKLALERSEIGVDLAFGENEFALGPTVLGRLRARLRLTDRKPLLDDVPGQILRIGSRCDGSGVTHTDIASQKRLTDKFRKIE